MLDRSELPGARDDRLFFAQVREDPRLEVTALKGHWHGPVAMVGSAGCTALSLLAEGAEDVVAIDLNRSQNHLVELKAAAVSRLGPRRAAEFLGGLPAATKERFWMYGAVRPILTPAARTYWDARRPAVTRGVLGAGVTERLMRVIAGALRLVHPRSRVRRMLACRTLDDQRALFRDEWDTAGWRLLFEVLCNRLVLRRAYDPAFFEHVADPSFARHFRQVAERTLTELPVRDNYFLHHMLTGTYSGESLPPYLETAFPTTARLSLVDAAFTDHLRTVPDGTFTGFALSNICEWLTPAQIDDLFGEIVRTARPGARLVFRNFVGWTEVPARWRHAVREDRALGEELMRLDRSLCQRRFTVCDIRKES